MFSFNSSDVFGAYEYMQEVKASVLRFNEANTDRFTRVTESDFYKYTAEELSPSREEFVRGYFAKFLMLSDEDGRKRCEDIVEAHKLLRMALNTANDLKNMHRGHVSMIEGMTQARQDRIHMGITDKYVKVLNKMRAALDVVMNLGWEPSEGMCSQMPTAADVADLNTVHGVWVDTDRVNGKTKYALEDTRDALNMWIQLVRLIEFPQVAETTLVDECNEAAEAVETAPALTSLDRPEAIFVSNVMSRLAPKEVSLEDVGTEWEPNVKRMKSLCAMLSALEMTPEEWSAFHGWKASVERWNEKRALVAQG